MFNYLQIAEEEVNKSIQQFSLPSTLEFGKVILPFMVSCDYAEGKWGELKMGNYGPISILPVAKGLHYGQQIFEGMKAYKVNSDKPLIFRPLRHFQRFNISAKRMCMPE